MFSAVSQPIFPVVRLQRAGLHAQHSTFRSLARVHRCGRVTLKVVCRSLHAPEINIRHLTKEGLECIAPSAVDPAEASAMMETEDCDDGASEPHSGAESAEFMEPGDQVSEEEPGFDSDYEG